MSKADKRTIVKDLILDGKITVFVDVFNYMDKKDLHMKTGINYYRLLRSSKNPKSFKFEDAYTIAIALKVPADAIIQLIKNQIDESKKPG